MSKYLNIRELSKILDFENNSNKNSTHIIRYWEKEFKQIKPKVINKRRYYSKKQVELIKLIKFLLKDKGLTIKGAKAILNTGAIKLDDHNSNSLKARYYKDILKLKTNKILNKIYRLRKYGKKNSH